MFDRYALLVRAFGTVLAFLPLMAWCSPATAEDGGPLPLAPVSMWVIDYAEESCALRRSFAAGSDQVVLELRAFGPGANFEVTVASAAVSRSKEPVQTRFEPDNSSFTPSDAVFLTGGNLRAVRFTDSLRPGNLKGASGPLPDWSDADRDARERAITELNITGVSAGDIILQIGRMDQPMGALRTCLDDLLKSWGVEPSVQRSLTRQAKAIDQMNWARRTQQGLPPDVVRAGGSGRAQLRLIVGPDGRATECRAVSTSGAPGFPDYACNTALRYARFAPAIDADGRPVATVFITTVSYQVD